MKKKEAKFSQKRGLAHTNPTSRQTPATQQAIDIPNDGPLFNYVDDVINEEIGCSETGLNAARHLLKMAAVQEVDFEATFEGAILRLLVTCQLSIHIKGQLQALQSFRSTILHLENQCKSWSEQDDILRLGIYRIILEWVVSPRSPITLKRAGITCLNALSTKESVTTSVHHSVVSSLLLESHYWSDPVETLFEIMSYVPTQHLVLHNTTFLVQALKLLVQSMSTSTHNTTITNMLEKYSFQASYQDRRHEFQPVVEAGDAVRFAQNVVKTLRSILLPLSNDMLNISKQNLQTELSLVLKQLEQSPLTALLQCKAMPSDGLSVVGVTRAQIQYLQWTFALVSASSIQKEVINMVQYQVPVDDPEQLSHLAIVRGLLAVIPIDCLVSTADRPESLMCGTFAPYLWSMCHQSSAAVCLSALRGWDGWLSRATSSRSELLFGEIESISLLPPIIDLILEIWSKPQSRQIRAILPVVFNSLLSFVDILAQHTNDNAVMDSLTDRILSQPLNRKVSSSIFESFVNGFE